MFRPLSPRTAGSGFGRIAVARGRSSGSLSSASQIRELVVRWLVSTVAWTADNHTSTASGQGRCLKSVGKLRSGQTAAQRVDPDLGKSIALQRVTSHDPDRLSRMLQRQLMWEKLTARRCDRRSGWWFSSARYIWALDTGPIRLMSEQVTTLPSVGVTQHHRGCEPGYSKRSSRLISRSASAAISRCKL